MFSLKISYFLLTSFESCDLETTTAIFTHHITPYTTQAITHAHFGSVKNYLNHRISSIYGTSVQRAAATKTKRHTEAENDTLE